MFSRWLYPFEGGSAAAQACFGPLNRTQNHPLIVIGTAAVMAVIYCAPVFVKVAVGICGIETLLPLIPICIRADGGDSVAARKSACICIAIFIFAMQPPPLLPQPTTSLLLIN